MGLEVCLVCGGAGAVPCSECGGKGKVGGLLGLGSRRCYGCDGEGRLPCGACGGASAALAPSQGPLRGPLVDDEEEDEPNPSAGVQQKLLEKVGRRMPSIEEIEAMLRAKAGGAADETPASADARPSASPPVASLATQPDQPTQPRETSASSRPTPVQPQTQPFPEELPVEGPSVRPEAAPTPRSPATSPAQKAAARAPGGTGALLAPRGPAAFAKSTAAKVSPIHAPFGEAKGSPTPPPDQAVDVPASPEAADAEDKTIDMPAPPGAFRESPPPEPVVPSRPARGVHSSVRSRDEGERLHPGSAPRPASSQVASAVATAPAVSREWQDDGWPGDPLGFEPADTDVNVVEPPPGVDPAAAAPADDPMELLRKALATAGRDPDMASDLVASHSQSGRRLREDLVTLALARRIYEQLVASGRSEHEQELAHLYGLEARERHVAGDASGAATLVDRGIVIWEGLRETGDHRHDAELARAFVIKAQAVESSEVTSRVALYDRAMQLQERLVALGEAGAVVDLARTLMAKGVALGYLGDPGSAVGAFDQASVLWRRLVEGGSSGHVDDLARAYMNKGVALEQLGDIRIASELYSRAIGLWRPMVEMGSHPDLAGDLAWTLAYSAAAERALGRLEVASLHAREAVTLLAAEIERTGRADLVHVLAWARSDLAPVL